MGDPAGIGPEVIAKALSRSSYSNDYFPVVIGDADILRAIVKQLQLQIEITPFQNFQKLYYKENSIPVYHSIKLGTKEFNFGTVQKGCGDFSFKTFVKGVELTLENKISALVTAPICKESWHLAGHHYDGHTGLLAKLTHSQKCHMMFSSEKLNIILVTAHMSVRDACDKITTQKVLETIRSGYWHLKQLGCSKPRIAVCGLNPHAGENGLFGFEDQNVIKPAIIKAAKEGILVEGPLPSDTVFLRAINGQFDLVVAQFHDQGLIPMKLVAFDTSVNITVGLPIIRTSVDHGTAFDIAGQGKANQENMTCAIDYAIKMVKHKKHLLSKEH